MSKHLLRKLSYSKHTKYSPLYRLYYTSIQWKCLLATTRIRAWEATRGHKWVKCKHERAAITKISIAKLKNKMQ